MTASEIKSRLEKKDQLIDMPTGLQNITSYIRFLSDGETAPLKSLRAKQFGGYDFHDKLNVIQIPSEIAICKDSYDFQEVKETVLNFIKKELN